MIRAIVLGHRYLGIGLCLFFAMWFATGIVMVFANDMPHVTRKMRLERAAVLNLASVRLSAAEAVARARRTRAAATAVLTTLLERPVYRFDEAAVFADTGDPVSDIDARTAQRIAARFAGAPAAGTRLVATLTVADQWTISQRRNMPLHKFVVEDAARTEVYVSQHLGDVVMMTTRRSRLLAMAGAIPHWLYMTPLRVRNGLWRQIILWTSGLGCVLALSGLVVGVLRFRRTGSGFPTPFSGWLKWHHMSGLVFGVVVFTWVFSGFLSMEPWGWASDDSEVDAAVDRALTGGPPDLSAFPRVDPAVVETSVGDMAVREIEFRRIHDAPYFVVQAGPGHRLVVAANPLAVRRLPFTVDSLQRRVAAALPGVGIADVRVQRTFDAYYYSRDPLPLPIVRVSLADERGTSLYIDPATSQLIGSITRRGRIERWLYHGLHSLDFPFWYYTQTVWRASVLFLLTGGLLVSVIGVRIAIQRLRKDAVRR